MLKNLTISIITTNMYLIQSYKIFTHYIYAQLRCTLEWEIKITEAQLAWGSRERITDNSHYRNNGIHTWENEGGHEFC